MNRNRAAWIVISILWVLAAFPAAVAAALSTMLFDSPGSESSRLTIVLFCAMVALPVFCLLGAGLPWIFYKWKFAKWLYLVPFLDVVFIVAIVVLVQTFCGGYFSCK